MPIGDLFNKRTSSLYGGSNNLYSSNTGISGYFNNKNQLAQQQENEDLQRAIRQTENTKARLIAAGQGDKIEKKNQFSITKLLKALAAPGYAANALIQEFTDPSAGSTPNKFDPLKAYWRGLTLQEEVEGSELVKDLGIKNNKLASVLGFVWDVVNPLDLLNWVSFGVGKAITKGGLRGTAALSAAYGDEAAETITRLLGKSVDDIGAETVGKLSNKIIDLAKEAGVNTNELAKIMTEGMVKTHSNLTTKLPYNTIKRLTVGFETPIGRNNLTQGIELPGTEYLVKAGEKTKDAFLDTRVGDRLAKMFSTKYKSKTLPDSVLLKKIQEAGQKLNDIKIDDAQDAAKSILDEAPEIVPDSIEIGPEINKAVQRAVEFTTEDAAEVYEKFREGITEIFEKTPRKEQQFFEQVETLFRGTTREDRQQVLDVLVGKLSEDQIPERLLPVVDGFREWRESIVKTYKKLEIPINELENYVPFIPVRALKESESIGIKSIFGEVKNLNTSDDVLVMYQKLDPSLYSRTINATDPRDINALLDKAWLSEDPAHMMMVRGSRAIRAEEAAKFINNFITQYGLTVEDLAKLSKVPKGYKLYENVVDKTGTRVLRQVTNLTENNREKIVAIPEEFANVFNEYMELFFNTDARNPVIKLFDSVTNIWKKFAYLYNPGHIPRDFAGNVWQGYLMGMRSPKYYQTSSNILKKVPQIMDSLDLTNIDTSDIDAIIKAYKQAVKNGSVEKLTVKVGNKTIDGFEAFMKARKYGALETAALLAETPKNIRQTLNIAEGKKVSTVVGKYEDLMRKITENTNNWTRFAGYLYQLGRGNSWTRAAANVKKFYFDYFDLTPFERKVMKRVIPFYTWTRKNIPMELQAMLQRPKDFSRVQKAIDAIEGESAENQEMPDWAEDVGLVALGDTGKYINPNLPYQDLGRLPINRDNIANLLASLNPLLRAPVEWATNTELYSGKPIEDYTGETQDMPIIGAIMRLLGRDNVPQVSKRNVAYFINQLPMLRNIDTILNPDNPRQGARLASMVGMPSYFDAEQLRRSEIYEENARLLELLRLLRDQGVDIPTTYELNNSVNPIFQMLGINIPTADDIRQNLLNRIQRGINI